MERTFVISNVRFAYVNQYYRNGQWHKEREEPRDELEGPRIALAEDRDGRVYVTRDVKAGGVYDTCGMLSVHLPSDAEGLTFKDLEKVAELLGLRGTFLFRKRLVECNDKPALTTFAGNELLPRHADQQEGAEKLAERLNRACPGIDATETCGVVMFYVTDEMLEERR